MRQNTYIGLLSIISSQSCHFIMGVIFMFCNRLWKKQGIGFEKQSLLLEVAKHQKRLEKTSFHWFSNWISIGWLYLNSLHCSLLTDLVESTLQDFSLIFIIIYVVASRYLWNSVVENLHQRHCSGTMGY